MGISCFTGKKQIYSSLYYKQSQQFLNHYTFGHKLGRGSTGEVMLAYHRQTNRKVAVKIFDKASIIKASTFKQIMTQKYILQQLSVNKNFPFFTHLIETLQDRSNLYMVLQYFQNENLRNLLERKKQFNLQQLKFITICLLLTLEFLDERKIIHGDIKPQNILIDSKCYFYVADFSSARYHGCKSCDLKGTRKYSAPQLTARNSITLFDNRTDLYSLGLVLWEMAYGMSYWDFKFNSRKKSEEAQKTSDSFSNQSQPSGLRQIEDYHFTDFVELLLKQNINKRPKIQAILCHPWLGFSQSVRRAFLKRSVSPHPFQPLEEYFTGQKKEIDQSQQRNVIDLEQSSDELFRTVLLNERKYQQMFIQFSLRRTYNLKKQQSNNHI